MSGEELKTVERCKVCNEIIDERWLTFFEVHQIGGMSHEALVKIYIDDLVEKKRVFSMDNIDYMQTQLENIETFNVRMNSILFYLCEFCKDAVIKKLTEKKPEELAMAVKLLGGERI